MKQQSQQKLKKCLGILQIVSAFFMLAVCGLRTVAFIFYHLAYKGGGGDVQITWTGEVLFIFIYCILTTVIGGVLMFLGEKLTGPYIITDKPSKKESKDCGNVKELLVIILNIVFILLTVAVAVLIVRLYGVFGWSAFLFCALPLIPSVVIVILAFMLLKMKKMKI